MAVIVNTVRHNDLPQTLALLLLRCALPVPLSTASVVCNKPQKQDCLPGRIRVVIAIGRAGPRWMVCVLRSRSAAAAGSTGLRRADDRTRVGTCIARAWCYPCGAGM